jgi:hypothetical protein
VLAVGLAGIAAAGAWGSGCSAKKPTELVPGVFTQVSVPRNIAQVSIVVKANGALKFCANYDVSNGIVLLPETLGVVSGESASTTVSVEVRGYDQAGMNSNDAMGCTGAAINAAPPTGPGPRIIRRSVQSFVDQHVLFLPMPLSYSCFDTDCSTNQSGTCKGAQCVPQETDPTKLVDFDPALVDGTQDCFDSTTCFAAALPAVLLDPESCTYGFPSAEPTGTGLNVRVLYQDVLWKMNTATNAYEPEIQSTTEQEILDAEDTEGFTRLANQQFQLSKGLCGLVHAATNPPQSPAMGGPALYHTISAIFASDTCQSKTQLRPICKQERNTSAVTADGGKTTDVTCNVPVELVPVPSAIYLVMDDSSEMNGAFGDTGSATAMSLSLASPVFKRTFVAFQFLKHQASDCTAATPTSATPDHMFDFGPARTQQPLIAQQLLGWAAPGGPQDLYLEAAMRPEGAYARVKQFETALGEQLATGAVMFFLNRTPVGPVVASDAGAGDGGGGDGGLDPTQALDCDPPLAGGTDALSAITAEVQAAASGMPSMHTYFVVLDNAQHNHAPVTFFQQVASAPGTATTVLDATSMNQTAVLASFAQSAIELGTCLYELPPGIDSNAKIQFTNPLGPADSPPIPFNATCNAANADTVDGWNVENNRIRICGTTVDPGTGQPRSCFALRNTVLQVTAATLMQSQDGGVEGGVPGDGGLAIPPEVPVKATMPCVTTGTGM